MIKNNNLLRKKLNFLFNFSFLVYSLSPYTYTIHKIINEKLKPKKLSWYVYTLEKLLKPELKFKTIKYIFARFYGQ